MSNVATEEYEDYFVGFGTDIQFIHYTLEDMTIDTMKKYKKDMWVWQESIEKRLSDLEEKVGLLRYAPGMSGYLETEQHIKNPYNQVS